MTRKQWFEWVKEEYDTDPDYPWQDWNAVLRHKDSRKWYGLGSTQTKNACWGKFPKPQRSSRRCGMAAHSCRMLEEIQIEK